VEKHEPYPFPFERDVVTEPPPLYARLQRDEPVAQVLMPTGDTAFVVTRYEDTKMVLSDARFSVNRNRPGAPRPVLKARDDSMISVDPPDHSRLRRLVQRAFTSHQVDRLRPYIEATVRVLLDEMAASGPPADLVRSVAVPLPVTIICDLMGVPFADRALLRELSDPLVSYTAFSPEEQKRAHGRLREFMADLIKVKRLEPGDDVMSQMIAARDEDDQLSESELVSQAMLMLVAGHDPMVSLIGRSVVALLGHPEQLKLLREDPSVTATAVDELLRHDPPGDGGQYRIALEDVELSGTTIPAGSGVFACIPVANRDPRVFPDPDELDLARTANPHLSLGHGPHFCLGAALARAELRLLLPALLQRFPGLRLAVPASELRWQYGMRVTSYTEIPLTW
jgi:nocardicin N-oxygenase